MNLVLLTVALLLQSSCLLFDNGSKLPGGAEYYEIKKVPRENEEVRKELFYSYSQAKQIDIYLFAMIYKAPSDTVFGEYLLENGASRIPELVNAIETSNSPMAKGYLIGVIWQIEQNCSCLTEQDLKRLKLTEPVAEFDETSDVGWKRSYRWVLFELERRGPENRHRPEMQNVPNPYSNSNSTR